MAVQLSWLERPVHTREVGGSIPSAAIYFIETLDLQLNWLEHSAHNRAVVGSSPTRSIFFVIWRITQVRLKGTVLKTVRRVKACVGSNPTSSFKDIAGWSSQVARRAHNPKVVGSNPAPAIGSVAQLVEQWIEAPCVGGSIPSRAIYYISFQRVQFSGKTTAFQAVVASSILVTRLLYIKVKPSICLGAQLRWLERTPDKREVGGSSPLVPININLENYSRG